MPRCKNKRNDSVPVPECPSRTAVDNVLVQEQAPDTESTSPSECCCTHCCTSDTCAAPEKDLSKKKLLDRKSRINQSLSKAGNHKCTQFEQNTRNVGCGSVDQQQSDKRIISLCASDIADAEISQCPRFNKSSPRQVPPCCQKSSTSNIKLDSATPSQKSCLMTSKPSTKTDEASLNPGASNQKSKSDLSCRKDSLKTFGLSRKRGSSIAHDSNQIMSATLPKKIEKRSRKSSKTSIKSNASETYNDTASREKNNEPDCSCHLPPLFSQYYHCTGDIAGNCSCSKNN